MNQFDLQAKLISKDVIRETPSGTPVVDFRVEYDGEISEAGFKRLVKLSIDCVAIGDLSGKVSKIALGSEVGLTGFLANRGKNYFSIKYHVQDIVIGKE
ncbi:MAG: primosomal replication protein N [Betaproteobacteria bacterium]